MIPIIMERRQDGAPTQFFIADEEKYKAGMAHDKHLVCGYFSSKEDAQRWMRYVHHNDWNNLMEAAHDSFNGDDTAALKIYLSARMIFFLAHAQNDFCIQSIGCDCIVFGGWNRVNYYVETKRWEASSSHCTHYDSFLAAIEQINALGL